MMNRLVLIHLTVLNRKMSLLALIDLNRWKNRLVLIVPSRLNLLVLIHLTILNPKMSLLALIDLNRWKNRLVLIVPSRLNRKMNRLVLIHLTILNRKMSLLVLIDLNRWKNRPVLTVLNHFGIQIHHNQIDLIHFVLTGLNRWKNRPVLTVLNLLGLTDRSHLALQSILNRNLRKNHHPGPIVPNLKMMNLPAKIVRMIVSLPALLYLIARMIEKNPVLKILIDLTGLDRLCRFRFEP